MAGKEYPHAPIDVTNWRLEDQSIYPEGAKPKTALFAPEELDFPYIDKRRRYLYKRSSHAPADQFWVEIVAYRIGCMLGVNVPPCYPAFDSINNTSGALVEWFYIDDAAMFIHGADYFKRRILDFDMHRGTQHNLTDILHICRALSKWSTQLRPGNSAGTIAFDTDIIRYWGTAILFDALIGNSDRHQSNWGVVVSSEDHKISMTLSPLFDNGTSMGGERFLKKLEKWSDQQFEKYVANGRHHMKIHKDDTERANHFELLKYYVGLYPDIKAYLYDTVMDFSLEALSKELMQLTKIDLPERLTAKRIYFYMKLITLRLNRLKAILNEDD